MKSRKLVLVLGAVALALSACTVRLTPDGTAYTYDDSTPGTVVVSASATTGSNERELFFSPASPWEADSTVCATFANGGWPDQQGIALRINENGGQTTGITVTRNIAFGNAADFNFHTWDTKANPTYSQFGSTEVPTLPFVPVYPLNMCARTQGELAQFVVWLPGTTEPAWGDPTWGGQATIPASAPDEGRGGFFAGHLVPGTSMEYDNLTVDGATPVEPS